jgi:hypothetical protein
MKDEDRWISLPDACVLAKRDWRRMWGAALKGDLEAKRVGGRWYVHLASLEKYLSTASTVTEP